MKFIAKKDFARVAELVDVVDPQGLKHPGHVHKGTTFSIGKADALGDLSKRDQMLVATLILSGSVADATDAKAVKAVQDDIAQDKRREEEAARRNAAADGSALIAQLTALMAKAAK